MVIKFWVVTHLKKYPGADEDLGKKKKE